MRRIAIATTTRADWGLLSPLAGYLRDHGAETAIIAGGSHYDKPGETFREIIADGFDISAASKPSGTLPQIAATTLNDFYQALEAVRPDSLICLGDRYEMLSVAQAATMLRTPIIHIAGGTVSEGAFDDSFRHAITKLSSLHLTETEEARGRVIQMGEDPERVIATGAIGIHNILAIKPMEKQELEESIGFRLDGDTLLATMHAATMDAMPAEVQLANLLKALDRFPQIRILFTYPNNDCDPAPLITLLHEYERENPERVKVVPSLGRLRYISALRYMGGVIGNSSSGIVEVPSMGIPTLDIGIRQRGRTSGPSVEHCGNSVDEIAEGIKKITGKDFRSLASRKINPYARLDTLKMMGDTILGTDPSTLLPKKFHDCI